MVVKSAKGPPIIVPIKLPSAPPVALKAAFAGLSPSSQALIFLDEQHGAGGIIANGQVYPEGTTIYGRWTEFKPSAAGVICYFGK